MTLSRTAALFAIVTSVAACSGRAADKPNTDSRAEATPPPAAALTPAVAHGASPAAQAAQVQAVTGAVVETMNASNYTYVRVKTDSGEVWAATSQFPVKVGDRVTVPLESPMENFHSQSLNRDFPLIYFASAIMREGETPAAPAGNPHGSAPAAAPTVTEPIAPPPGAMTIAQLWADRAKLAGKKVTVRGKVVKYNAGILDRNWIHIQDGSGKPADKTNDLTLTTNDTTALGEVITVTGTVTLNKDFGAGYAYVVMLESAAIQK